ncbi:MAG TPA: ArsI/CadI family heavy metal resistance metalloenzyme [Gammaproteobacteria bacterium]|nr:ArsI/CadI family heavy metal resistance metalloenzyme [Gammaproteobacteria bacterium]
MKRLHVHVAVADLGKSIRFYSTLFGTAPTVEKPDYAKWMLEDPQLNFAISARDRKTGVNHLGIQVADTAELEAIGARLKAAEAVTRAEQDVACCYARSDKYWAEDPQGVRWESFHTHGETTVYSDPHAGEAANPCYTPTQGPGAALPA